MKKTIFYILTLALFAISFKGGDKGGIKFNTSEWKDVTREAKNKDKPIFAMVCAPWCSNCAKMKETVFPDSEVGSYFNENFVCTMINSEDNRSNMRVTGWGVKAVPTMVFLDRNKKVVHTVSGFKNKAQMLQEAEIALGKMK